MISHKYKCIFIHPPKTGGTSLSVAIDSEYNIARESPEKHWNAEQCKQEYSVYWDEYYKFATVRNPWDRAVSFYRYFRYFDVRIEASTRTFKEWLNLAFIDRRFNCWGGVGCQMDFLMLNGKNCVDFVLKFERLESDFLELARRLSINSDLPHYNGRFHKADGIGRKLPYQSYYDEESIEIVREFYQRDISSLGYAFE